MSTEQQRIQTILSLVARHRSRPGSGLGASVGVEALDDCAVIPISGELDLVIGSDFVRGQGFHLFKRGILSNRDIGYYLIGANASDLAAMGASPIGVVVVLRYTSTMTDADFEAIMDGVTLACADMGIPLLGGDTGGYESSVLSAAAVGVCPSGRALLRAGARPGDVLFLSDEVGLAGAALAYFTRATQEGLKLPRDAEETLANAWRRVRPALAQGQLLVQKELSRCAIDTSDGLKAACRQLAEASKVDILLSPERIPIHPVARDVAKVFNVDPLALGVGDSVDFRLLFSVSKSKVQDVWQAFNEQSWPLYEIGRIEASADRPGVFLEQGDKRTPLPGVEWAQSETLAIDDLRKQAL